VLVLDLFVFSMMGAANSVNLCSFLCVRIRRFFLSHVSSGIVRDG